VTVSYQLGQIDSDHNELFAEPREQGSRPRFRGLMVSAAALAAVGVFAGGLWFAYHQGLRHGTVVSGGDVPLIRADERPTRVKPEKPGGMEIPDRDKLIYTQKRAAVEHLLPPPEKPMPRPTAPLGPTQQGETLPTPAIPAVSGATSATPPIVMPAQQQPMSKPADKNKSASAAPAKASTAQGAQAQTAGARIQLGSVRSEEAAQREWYRIKRANSDLLGSLSSATPIRVDLGEKGVFYRIQTGPIADADRICGELKRRNIGCIIAR
jgi:hypothetical protein